MAMNLPGLMNRVGTAFICLLLANCATKEPAAKQPIEMPPPVAPQKPHVQPPPRPPKQSSARPSPQPTEITPTGNEEEEWEHAPSSPR